MSSEDPSKEVWEILVRAAAERRTLTYGQLADRLGGAAAKQIPRNMKLLLNPIAHYCDQHGLPRLSDLVVNQRTQRPSYDPGPGYDFAAAREAIFAFDWRGRQPHP